MTSRQTKLPPNQIPLLQRPVFKLYHSVPKKSAWNQVIVSSRKLCKKIVYIEPEVTSSSEESYHSAFRLVNQSKEILSPCLAKNISVSWESCLSRKHPELPTLKGKLSLHWISQKFDNNWSTESAEPERRILKVARYTKSRSNLLRITQKIDKELVDTRAPNTERRSSESQIYIVSLSYPVGIIRTLVWC